VKVKDALKYLLKNKKISKKTFSKHPI